LVAAPAAHATFHEILVREVYAGGADNDSYVVLQAYSGGQNALGGHSLTAYGPTGTALGTFSFPGAVTSGQNQMTVLVTDTAYATGFPGGPAPDGIESTFNLNPGGGAVCWAGLDCMSWGSFSGTTSPSSGSPADPAGIPANMALRRSIAADCATLLQLNDDTNVSSADFEDATPNPRANSSPITETPCAPSTAPNTTIGDPKPATRTKSTEAEFFFTATPATGASFECKLDSEPAFTACASPQSYAGLGGGTGTSHSFQVRAVHPTNGTDPSPASHTWIVDTVAPVATIDSQPLDPSPGGSAAFGFHASESSSFECSLVPAGDPDDYESCNSIKTYTNLADGEYTFELRATDLATNVGAVESYGWTVDNSLADTTPPQTTLGSHPPDPSPGSTASFTYSSNEPGSSFECSLDGVAFAACSTAGITYSGLGSGPHSFQVRAIDAEGNVDPTPAGYSFQVVLPGPGLPAPAPGPLAAILLPASAPQTTISAKPPVKTSDRTPTFRFGSSPAGASYQCQLDRGPFKSCRSPFTTKSLAPGRHTFKVRAIVAGLADPTPASFSFKVVKPARGRG
jgi:large repetitive protein